MIVIPKNIDFERWASTLYVDLPTLDLPVARNEDDWKQWARQVININQLSGVPSPNYYDNWRDWAYYFVNNVQ